MNIPFLVLAQATTSRPAAPQGGGLETLLVPFLLMAAVFYFIMIRPQSAEKKKREAMLSAIKKNDRVVTVGGILGTVLSVKDDEITLKVDESSNTKITFTRSAINRVVGAAPAENSTTQPIKKA